MSATRRKVVHVEFTKKVLLRATDPNPVQKLDAKKPLQLTPTGKPEKCPDMWLEGGCIVVGVRRFPLASVVESFDLEE